MVLAFYFFQSFAMHLSEPMQFSLSEDNGIWSMIPFSDTYMRHIFLLSLCTEIISILLLKTKQKWD